MNKQPSRTGKVKPSKDTKGKTISTENKPATLFEIVPGKFNENDWNNMLEIDDSQEFIWEIIDEIFDSSIKVIYDKYLDNQTIPYTINEARKAILHIIDWQFLTKDTDDDLTECWVQDEEPDACVIDSWAQGYVQTVLSEEELKKENDEMQDHLNGMGFLEELNRIIEDPKSDSSARQDENSSRDIPFKTESSGDAKDSKKVAKKQLFSINNKNETIKTKTKQTTQQKHIKLEKEPVLEEVPPPPPVKHEKTFISEIKRLEEPISKAPLACQSVLKTLLSRPLALREIEIDSTGNIQNIAKLDFDKVPSNNVRPRFNIGNESKSSINYDGLRKSKLNSISSILIAEENLSSSIRANSAKKAKRLNRKSPPPRKSKSHAAEDENEVILEPAPGVVFTMLNATRTGPKKSTITTKQQIILEKSESLLKPVKQYDNDEKLMRSSIEQILGPTIKLPVKLRPIPPINASTTVN